MEQQPMMFDDQLLAGEYVVPADTRRTVCRLCNAPIYWTRSANDKPVPLAARTVRQVGAQLVAMNHFVDCPEYRKGQA
jgi:hypothetical protein